MKRLALLLCSVAFLLGCPEGETMVPMRAPVAELSELDGTVTLQRGTDPAAAAARGALFEADVIATGPKSRALLRGITGEELELQHDTRFKVGKSLGAIQVEQGTITFSMDDLDGGGSEVTTPFGRTRLAAGTRATLSVESGRLGIDVSVGEIEQTDIDGGTRSAAAGQRLDVSMGSIEMTDIAAPPKPVVPPPPEKLAASFAVEAGRPALKKKGESKFSAAKKEAQPVAEGTAFVVPAGSRARLTTDRIAMRLSDGAVGSIESVEKEGDEPKAQVPLSQGQANVNFEGPATLILGRTRVHAKGEASVSIVASKKGDQVEVLAGEVDVITAGGTKTVKAGERAEVSNEGAQVVAQQRPAVVLPIGKRVRVYLRRPIDVGLGLPEAPARMQVASDAQFAEVLLSGEGKDFVSVPAPLVGELHWKSGEQEGHARFLTDKSSLTDSASRSDVVAETGLKATVYFQSSLPALTFTFPAAVGAKSYRLKVYRSNELKTPLFEKKIAENKCTVESGQLPEGSYVWFASPLDDAGNESGGGRMNKMEIIYDNSLTTLSIASPKDGDRSGGKVAGVAPLGSRLFVNGKPIALENTGRYSGEVGKAELLVFRLVGADGSESYWLRRLKR